MSGVVTVKNISIKTTEKCNCGSWLNHWNNFNSKPPVFCSENRCTHMFHLFGAHVQKVGDDENWYIIPLCEKHGKSEDELIINHFVKFISADINKTCG